MRISDWSSDVCSSDLVRVDRDEDVGLGRARQLRAAVERDEHVLVARQVGLQAGRGVDLPGQLAADGKSDVLLTATALADRAGILATVARIDGHDQRAHAGARSEEHTSELQSLMRTTYADFCLQKTNTHP